MGERFCESMIDIMHARFLAVGDSIGITKNRFNFTADSEGIRCAHESVSRPIKHRRMRAKTGADETPDFSELR